MSFAELSDEQLAGQVSTARRELVEARFQHSMGQLENSSQLKRLRRQVAKLLTETRNREIAQELPRDSLLAKYKAVVAPVENADAEEAAQGGFLQGIVDKISG
jgi:large subunit ribosomal protein L29